MKTFTIVFHEDATITHEMIGGRIDHMVIQGDNLEVRDEYHSMEDLYYHRMALNIALFHAWKELGWDVVKSKLHHDGTMFEGDYFIVWAKTPKYHPFPHKQISYHYHLKHWDKFKIPEVERIMFQYDGHTSNSVLELLENS